MNLTKTTIKAALYSSWILFNKSWRFLLRTIIIIAVVAMYFGGVFHFNGKVRDTCFHGNCTSGWQSKYNKNEQSVAVLWMIGYPIIMFLLVSVALPKRHEDILEERQRLDEQEKKKMLEDSSPRCPECGSYTVIRTAYQGKFLGKSFWGCSKYPDCTGLIPFDSV